jgi:hypothetical protein
MYTAVEEEGEERNGAQLQLQLSQLFSTFLAIDIG